jgi:hypothetical protein
MLPVFALISPPVVFLFALVAGEPYGRHLLEAYVLLGYLSPVLGLLTLAILLVQFLFLTPQELEAWRIDRRRAATLAVFAVIAPAWLIGLFFIVGAFFR